MFDYYPNTKELLTTQNSTVLLKETESRKYYEVSYDDIERMTSIMAFT